MLDLLPFLCVLYGYDNYRIDPENPVHDKGVILKLILNRYLLEMVSQLKSKQDIMRAYAN